MPYCPSCGKEVGENIAFCPNCGRNLRQVAPQPESQATQGIYDPDISTAKTLTIVAIILQLAFFVIGFGLVLFFFFVFAPFTTTGAVFPLGVFGLVFGFLFVISFVWTALDYFLVYKNLDTPDKVPSARTPALALGIIQLFFSGAIPGILLILAYVKISDSLARRERRY